MSTAATTVAFAAAAMGSSGALLRTVRAMRARFVGLALMVIGWVGAAASIAPDSVRTAWPALVVAVTLTGVVGWVLGGMLCGREAWVLGIGALVSTVRVQLHLGGETVMLLAPLYLVIAVAAATLLRREWAHARTGGMLVDRGGATRLLDVGTALLPTIATLSILWSFDRHASATTLAFFLLPFLLVYAVVRSWAQHGVSLRPAAVGLLVTSLVAAALALYQAVTRTVWWNPKVIESNLFRADVRVNSIYWDPNILGRVLVIAALLVAAWLISRPEASAGAKRTVPGAAGFLALAVLALALWHTYSQSSWTALAGACVVLAVLCLPGRTRRVAAVVVALVVIVGVPFAARGLSGTDESGRAHVVHTGLHLFRDRPLQGHGVGTFEAVANAAAKDRSAAPGLTASHTTPVTVLAELGVLGGLAYVVLLGSAAACILARWRRAAPGWPSVPLVWATGTLVALVLHSLLYAGFFEDATLWAALAVIASLPPLTTRTP